MRHKPTTEYTGKVGAKMRARKGPVSRKATTKTAMGCIDGPMRGHTLFLCSHTTLVMVIAGQKGRYFKGKWEAVCA